MRIELVKAESKYRRGQMVWIAAGGTKLARAEGPFLVGAIRTGASGRAEYQLQRLDGTFDRGGVPEATLTADFAEAVQILSVPALELAIKKEGSAHGEHERGREVDQSGGAASAPGGRVAGAEALGCDHAAPADGA